MASLISQRKCKVLSPMIYDPADSDCENEESLRNITSQVLCCAPAECDGGNVWLICWWAGSPIDSDANVHKTNSFFKLNFQFVSISQQNKLFYSYITMIETKIKTNLFKNH
jgi:hypothetical protein